VSALIVFIPPVFATAVVVYLSTLWEWTSPWVLVATFGCALTWVPSLVLMLARSDRT